MAKLRINGSDSDLPVSSVPRVVDLVELVKAHIDPDHMITEILWNGRELEESDWYAATSTLGDVELDIFTGSPVDFVSSRLVQAADVVKACVLDFQDARKFFQDGDMATGNKRLSVAVNTLKAFFEWYGSLLELMPEERRSQFDITTKMSEISETCKRACQHQLYSSWWALGETIEKDLEPKLTNLEGFCRSQEAYS